VKKLIIVLLILLVLIGVPYAYLSFYGDYDSSKTINCAVPISSAKRYSINAKDREIGIKISKDDIYYMLSRDSGGDALQLINEQTKDYGIAVQKIGLSFNEQGGALSAKLMYKNIIPLPVDCTFSLKLSGSRLIIIPEELKLAGLINVDISKFISSEDIPEYDLTELYPLFSKTTSLKAAEGGITFSIPYPLEWLMADVPANLSDFTMILDFVKADEVTDVLPVMMEYISGNSDILAEKLDSLAGVPGGFAKLKEEIIAIGGFYTQVRFFEGDGGGNTDVLFPEISAEGAKSTQKEILDAYQAKYDERTKCLADTGNEILRMYAEGEIVISGSSFVYTTGSWEKLIPTELESMAGAEEWMDVTTLRVIMGKNPGNYLLRQTKQGMSVPVLILRTNSGRPVVAYQVLPTRYKIVSLLEKEYTSLFNSYNVPTRDLGEATTQRR